MPCTQAGHRVCVPRNHMSIDVAVGGEGGKKKGKSKQGGVLLGCKA